MIRLILLSTLLLPATAQARRAGPASCIDLDQVVEQQPAGTNAIRFTLTGKRVVTNTLANECPRLDRLNRDYRIVWDNRDGRRVCTGDRFRLIEPTQARAVGAGGYPFCRLGSFQAAPR